MFGIGFFATTAVAPSAGGSYELIETITVGSGGAASVTFSNLNTYSSTYQHLQIRAVVRGNNAQPWETIRFTFNGDTASNYNYHNLVGSGSSVTSSATANNFIQVDGLTGNTATSGAFGACVIDILDPYETKNTTTRALSGRVTADNQIGLHSGLWRNTAALTSISLTTFSGTILQYSRFSIYGLRGV